LALCNLRLISAPLTRLHHANCLHQHQSTRAANYFTLVVRLGNNIPHELQRENNSLPSAQTFRDFREAQSRIESAPSWGSSLAVACGFSRHLGSRASLSRLVRRCVLRAPSLTRDPRPSRITRKSYGPRVPDRTMRRHYPERCSALLVSELTGFVADRR
jgi:hypothetical protein